MSDDRLEALRRMRDNLSERLVTAPDYSAAALARALADIMTQIESTGAVSTGEVTKLNPLEVLALVMLTRPGVQPHVRDAKKQMLIASGRLDESSADQLDGRRYETARDS